jgi:hypothetical protein
MAASPRSFQGRRAATSGKKAGQAFTRMADLFDEHRAAAQITAGAEDGGNTRRFTIQVVDRLREPWKARWRVLVKIGTAADGDPAGTQTVSVATGTLLQTIAADQLLMVLSTPNGLIEVDVTIAGAETRYLAAEVVGKFDTETGAITWA